MNDWISVKDRLPEEHGYDAYLVYLDIGHVMIADFYPEEHEKYYKQDESYWDSRDSTDMCDLLSHHVTHWMPLPEPPKE